MNQSQQEDRDIGRQVHVLSITLFFYLTYYMTVFLVFSLKDEHTTVKNKDESDDVVCLTSSGKDSFPESREFQVHSAVDAAEEGSTEKSQYDQVRTELSHLSSFNEEDTDTLDEGLQHLELTSSDNPLSVHDTATAKEANDHQEVTFDVNSVPDEVKTSVMQQFCSILGGREITVVTGGAPTSEEVKRFIITCFGGMPSDGYGATEVCLFLFFIICIHNCTIFET